MQQVSYIVVFPTIFSKNRIPQLIANIKEVLQIKNQQFTAVKRDWDVILVNANDPVFASSAINLLFGIERVAIARRVESDFKGIVSEIAAVGGNLLLKGERFLVKVDGFSRGFLTKDVEIAATSKIIEEKSNLGARPGTEQNHDKLLYCHLTKKNAYVCIFTDDGAGGIPLVADRPDAVCCIYDELSAISCYETIKQGFNPKITICYRKKSELISLARMLNHILPRLLRQDVTVDVLYIKTGKSSYQGLVSLVLEILINDARSCGISRVSVPVSSLVFPVEFVDYATNRVFESKKTPILPLSGLDSGMFADAGQLGLERSIPGLVRLLSGAGKAAGFAAEELEQALKSRQEVSVVVGPNNVHDFLDSLDH